MNIIDLVYGNAFEHGADGYIVKAGQGQFEYNWCEMASLAAKDGIDRKELI